jgi:choline dehydrogenase-like flavoprotein
VIFASSIPGFGQAQASMLGRFAHQHILLALIRDGFAPQSQGGRVSLRDDGTPILDYPLNEVVMDAARRALLTMAELQFAAGASHVLPVHEQAQMASSWAQAKAMIERLPMVALQTRVVSAHVMGGCGMAANAHQGVTRPDGIHWHISNLSIHDGSLFPTSIGANPQLSIYGLVNRLTQQLIQRMGRVPNALA